MRQMLGKRSKGEFLLYSQISFPTLLSAIAQARGLSSFFRGVHRWTFVGVPTLSPLICWIRPHVTYQCHAITACSLVVIMEPHKMLALQLSHFFAERALFASVPYLPGATAES